MHRVGQAENSGDCPKQLAFERREKVFAHDIGQAVAD
jgi:hypothetical protein